MSYTLMILGMSLVTVFVKAVLFIAGERITFPPLVRDALNFVPVTVLTAIIVPMVLAPQGGGLELTWRNPQLVGAIAAIVICLLTRQQLVTIIGGLAVFFGWQFLVLA
jgi:branched-subunit amino acid transport protein